MSDVFKNYDLVLDVDMGNIDKPITLIQSSSRVRSFNILLTKEDSPFDLTNCLVKTLITKSDENTVFDDIVIKGTETGEVVLNLSAQAMAESGITRCEIIVIDVMEETFIPFPTFKFKVKASDFVQANIESSTELTTLINAIAKVEVINDIADEKFAIIDKQLEESTTKVESIIENEIVSQESADKITLLLSNSSDFTEQITNNCTVSSTLLEEIGDNKGLSESYLNSAIANGDLIVDIKNNSTEAYNGVVADKTKVETLVNAVQTNKNTSDTILTRITTNETNSKKSLTNITNNEKEVTALTSEVRTNTTQSYNRLADINKILSDSRELYEELVYIVENARLITK